MNKNQQLDALSEALTLICNAWLNCESPFMQNKLDETCVNLKQIIDDFAFTTDDKKEQNEKQL